MTTEQTAQQLELAAQILRTGHPFEVRHDASDKWHASLGVNPAQAVLQDWHIRPVLATPPDNRPVHNPDGLTAEQVGVGYRLTVEGESVPGVGAEWWCRSSSAWLTSTGAYLPQRNTVRLPLSVPWPEPAFQLPPPPPGMRWHREDGWKADDLPSGYRPLVDGEKWVAGDEILRFAPHGWQIGGTPGDVLDEPTHGGTSRCRTARPLIFNHAGKTWTWHRPGDPMPCDGGREVVTLLEDLDIGGTIRAGRFDWSQRDDGEQIIGWRYADEKKTVKFGPEDVLPGSVFRPEHGGKKGHERIEVVQVCTTDVRLGTNRSYDFEELEASWLINRSIPITGKWNPDAWEPCSKQIPV